jgi:ribosomal protein L11 methyltransferase
LSTVAVTVLTVPASDAELAADRLMAAGAFAVEERAAAEERAELRAVLAGSVEESMVRIGALPTTWSLHVERVDDEPLDTWREFAEPITIGDDLVLRPAWLDPIGKHGVTEVAIEPGATFGLGDHPTTRLSAAAVWRCAGDGDRVLDVGCGSGVLAIVAALAGAREVTAIDVAPPAPEVVAANAARNGVSDVISASNRALADVDASFDLVAANILAPTLVALAGDLRRVTADSGVLIVSGVLAGRHDHVLEALRPMRVVRTDVLARWAAVELRHPVSAGE